MGNCIYCGKPAGLLRKHHPECKARHNNAYSVIPEFFGKVIDSAITPQRFGELLQAAARESYVGAAELKKLCRSGFSNAISAILNERMMAAAELRRVNELVDALGANLPGGLELDELLAKIGVIVDLGDGKIPDCVSIAGPIPLDLEPGESILWVFNQATLFRLRRRKRKDSKGTTEAAEPVVLDERYHGPGEIEKAPFSREKFIEEGTGDLLLTDRNLYFLPTAESSLRIPVADIRGVQAYAEAVSLTIAHDDETPRTFLLDDAWFAANTFQRLSELNHAEAL